MYRILFSSLMVLAISLSVTAQCNGVYFKETSRSAFSDPFAYWTFEDFDGDGLNEIFGYKLTAETNYQIFYYQRSSQNSFDTTAKITTLTNVNNVLNVFGDVNNDGKKDLIMSHPTTPPIITTYLNDGTGRFLTNTTAVNVNNNERFWVAGDLNNDGKADVLSTIYNSPNSTLYYRLAQPDNTFGAAVSIATFPSFISGSPWVYNLNSGIIIEDLNNDGLKDISILVYDQTNNTNILKVLTNSGSNNFTETLSTSFHHPYTKLRPVDLNNDGKKDFVSGVFQDSGNSKIKLVANNGNNTFTSSEVIVPSAFSVNSYYVNDSSFGDFDGDGKTDIILPGAKSYLFLKNQGNLTFTQQQFQPFLRSDSAESISGDSKTDILTIEKPFIEGTYRLFSPNALFFLYSAVRFRSNVCDPVGQTTTVDFDGDGFTDRAFWNPSNGYWRYYNGATQNDQVYYQFGSGSFGDVPAPNDYDGDGRTDYAVYRKPTGTWYIVRSSDQQVIIFRFGLTEDKPVPADYDGDGKADIAVYRPSEGNWYIWMSQSNQFYAAHFGVSEDKPVPADYDGDYKADLAVFRPSSGVWYRLNSADGSFFAVQYGISTDKPVPADYEADGKANVAVFRDGTWYVLKNNFATSVFYWGTANDAPFFGTGSYNPMAFVYRRTNSSIYGLAWSADFGGESYQFSTGNSFNETLVSSTQPAE